MSKTRKVVPTLILSLSLLFLGTSPALADDDWGKQHIDSFSFGGLFEGSSKDMYFGYTRYKQEGIGLGVEVALYRYKHTNDEIDYSSTYTERDLSLTFPVAATDKIYISPSLGVRQIKNSHELEGEGLEHEVKNYEALYGLDLTYMLDNVSITIGADKSKSSEWSVSYGLGVSF